jgi:large subunit ribosomal protein L22
MTGPKTNERAGTRATLRGYHMSASKARVVLNLIRGEDVTTAREILAGTTREAADVIAKVLASAVANAVNNDALNAEELYVAAAFADEGITMKRFTPRARGRAGAIRKRACHITVVVARLDEERLEIVRSARSAQATASRARRVSSSRRRADQTASLNKRENAAAQAAEDEALEAQARDAELDEIEVETFDNESGAIHTPVEDIETDETVAQEFDATSDATSDAESEVQTKAVAPEMVEADVVTPEEVVANDETGEPVAEQSASDMTASDDDTEETN